MYCPKCGSTLSMGQSGNFECPQGLEFSVALSRRLREHYPAASTGAHVLRDVDGTLRWFCPGCGVDHPGSSASCSVCGVSMTPDIAHSLIELHPHPNGRGGWF